MDEAELRVSSPSIARTKRSHREPWKWLRPVLPLAAGAAAPMVLAGPLGVAAAGVGVAMSVVVALTWLVGRGDVMAAMSGEVPGTLAITSAQLVVDAGGWSERFDRAEVAGGWLEVVHESSYLVLQMRSGVVVRARASRDEGTSVLEALGLEHDPRAATLRLGSPQPTALGGVHQRAGETLVLGCSGLLTSLFGLIGVLAVLLPPPGPGAASAMARGFLAILVSAPLTYFLVRRILTRIPPAPTLARIGAEGVELVRRGRRRWIPFADLASVSHQDGAVHFLLKSQREVSVTTASDAEARAVGERVLAAQAWAARGSTAEQLGWLDRGSRTLPEWRGDLARLAGRNASGYRHAAIDEGALAEVVEDGTASPERRIAAAFVLSSCTQDDALRKRVRVAAEASAGERLRIALMSASRQELEEEPIEDALDESRERAHAHGAS